MGFRKRYGAGLVAAFTTAALFGAPALAEPAPAAPAQEPAAAVAEPAAQPQAPAPAPAPDTNKSEAAPPETAPAPTSDQAAAETASPVLLGAKVRARIDSIMPRLEDAEARDAKALQSFYQARRDEPIWIEGDALNGKAKAAMAEMAKAADWGLDPAAFSIPEAHGSLDAEQASEVEMSLSLAVLTYARHARGGRITEPAKQLSSYLDRTPQLLEPKLVIEQISGASEPDATLRGFHPKHPQFEKLRQKYLEMQASTKAAEEVVLLPKGPMLTPGKAHPDVALLRKRLKLPVPPATAETPADESYYDDTLAEAVKTFQSEKGLRPDGIVGSVTRNALNDIDVPDPARFIANMEQWRWMPDDLGSYHIWVNIPEYMVRVVKNGAIVHEERVITGLVTNQTPVFSADMELVTLNPAWNVPNSIKVNELYPSLARGGTYFEKQGLTLKRNGRPIDPDSVDWGSADIRQFDVQQPPGAANVLGVVKLSFPNKHIVYMHDTPTKNLFNETTRAFSHGCIRVRNPMRLAELVLEADKGWDSEKVASMRGNGRAENPITLDTKVPVHLTYFTSWIADDGTEQRWKDIYGHETRLKLALAGRFSEIAVGPDHLAPVGLPKVRYASDKNPFDTFMKNLFGGF